MNKKIVGGSLAAAGLAAGLVYRSRKRRYEWDGKRVLITGGSRGLGLVLARQLLIRGAHVAVCSRDGDELRQARIKMKPYDKNFMAARCDITDPDETGKMIHEVKRQFRTLDVLINNAGIISVGPQETMDIHDYRRVMEINFFGAMNVTLNILPEMRRQRSGKIINIVSIGGKISFPHLLPYNASKFALAGFSEGLCAELAKDHVSVTTVYPGTMRTGSPVNAEFKGINQEEYAWFSRADSLPLFSIDAERAARRILGAAQRGKPVVFLTLPAQIDVRFHGLFPGITARLLAYVNRNLLPPAGGIGKKSAAGKESFSEKSPAALTRFSDEAAVRNNEIRPEELRQAVKGVQRQKGRKRKKTASV